jgi:enediyne biosynthesis protein E7
MQRPVHRIAPGPRGHFLLGNLRAFQKDVLGLISSATAEHGDVVRFRLGPQVIHLLNHPDYAEQILQKRASNYDKQTRSTRFMRLITGESLLTSNGKAWKAERRMTQPAFHHQNIVSFATQMAEITAAMLDRWQSQNPAVHTRSISSEMSRLTYSIVGKTLFSFDSQEDADTVEDAMKQILAHTFRRFGQLLAWPDHFPTPANQKFRRALDRIDRIVYQIIQNHRAAQDRGEHDRDLLGMLLRLRNEEGDALNDGQLRNETMTFLLAGHETTANALTWAFHLIARNPEVEERLSMEFNQVLAGRVPVFTNLSQLTYTKSVIKEAMRLYPPIWILERRVIQEDEIAGYRLPAGSSVMISPYTLHRHPRFWENPETFDPDRFLVESAAPYIPFGLGPRFCIGHEFAMMEAQIILAMVLQRYRVRPMPGQSAEPLPGITLRAKNGMMLELQPRG